MGCLLNGIFSPFSLDPVVFNITFPPMIAKYWQESKVKTYLFLFKLIRDLEVELTLNVTYNWSPEKSDFFKNHVTDGTSLGGQWLRFHASSTQVIGSIPGSGTKIPYSVGVAKKITM